MEYFRRIHHKFAKTVVRQMKKAIRRNIEERMNSIILEEKHPRKFNYSGKLIRWNTSFIPNDSKIAPSPITSRNNVAIGIKLDIFAFGRHFTAD